MSVMTGAKVVGQTASHSKQGKTGHTECQRILDPGYEISYLHGSRLLAHKAIDKLGKSEINKQT